jgi:hypothetical protein
MSSISIKCINDGIQAHLMKLSSARLGSVVREYTGTGDILHAQVVQ